ncbi:MAG: acetyltransferase, partial [Acidimicrobiaceae bacterium]|nr:acetyltransferase [Acidimicrobiaceae bacterium]
MAEDLRIERVTEPTTEIVDAFAALLPQLSSSAAPLSATEIGAVARAPGNYLFVARTGAAVVGACLVATFPAPTGIRALL